MQLRLTFDTLGIIGLLAGVPAIVVAMIWLSRRYARRAASQTLRDVLAHLPLGAIWYTATGRRAFANQAAEDALQAFDPAQIDRLRLLAREDTPQTAVLAGRDGAAIQVRAWPVRDGSGALLTLSDMAQQQQASASYQKFIHTLSHELLTPLTGIRGHLAHIEASAQSDDKSWQGSLRIVQDEVERLTRLTSNLLILSRLEAGQPLQRRPTNLAAVAEEAVLQVMEKAEARRMTINLQAEGNQPRPPIDRDAWKQVFLNLLDNAVKYGSTGGAVDVVLRQEAGRLLIAVTDNGPGIAPDDLPHLFTELYRADAQRHVAGSGLGLAIVRRIVEQHGGQITCSSELGRGTRFEIMLATGGANVTSS